MAQAHYSPADKEYWEEFYSSGPGKSIYEWYAQWKDISHVVLPHIPSQGKILHVGCGNSQLVEQLTADPNCPGGLEFINTDTDRPVLEIMEARALKRSKDGSVGTTKCAGSVPFFGSAPVYPLPSGCRQCFAYLDCTDMSAVPTATMDMVLDKGTLDALLSTGKEEVGENASLELLAEEVVRVLKPGAYYFAVSRNDSDLIFPYFCAQPCVFETTAVRKAAGKASFSTVFIHSAKRLTRDEEDACGV
mmetsp:Transcript_27876/g.69903  ORF Transcript_27876/g.69903 Transcript_27876/m.69903 type:complete len:247 (-) Transcript_27876:32-772(-)|eukprot:CAMPEP_0177668360 /NCGR_PEP_ID=MMETSP0447-20121125/22715_1 /TAXON_ID=0 /ORGANISM="Stygamoeba regulata, Strain BSH-02190019" /LENGTH=246 /DNA_ID=CAMNT_0019174853 /DNA_START=61 /DNA_END=801 /DNA_ORIENTATION=-